MKIESSRNNHAENKKESSVRRGESALHRFLREKDVFDLKQTNGGAFEKILAETRKQNRRDDFESNLKNSADAETRTEETSDSLELALTGKDEVEEKEKRDGESASGEQADGGDGNHAFAPAQTAPSNPKSVLESPAAARSILHVADLERIVATIRSETFKNAKQVQIALKHSVLDGLQIKLTIDANGKLKAEFLAQNEQIKKQINARKNELREIFVQRAVNFSSIEVVDKNQNAE